MKVGTDAVLLGAWVNAMNAQRILDIGTGTGVIALMLAQKTKGHVDAIDIDENAFMQAVENVSYSPFLNKVTVHHISLQDFANTHQHKKYDLIVSNPPYFIDSSKSTGEARTKARHNDHLPFEQLLLGVLKLLDPKGKFYLILPVKEGELFRELAESHKLYLNKLVRVRTTTDKPEKRMMMRFEFERKSFSEKILAIELEGTRHQYTPEYMELTKDYYLAF